VAAVQSLLTQHPGENIRVFSIWEPAQMLDVAPPGRWALSTLTDTRVRQYWDPSHLVSTQIATDARPPQPKPDCCRQRGMFWDVAIVYPAGATWTDRLPPAILFNGPMIDIATAIEAAVIAARK
jgi:hypothetical protein